MNRLYFHCKKKVFDDYTWWLIMDAHYDIGQQSFEYRLSERALRPPGLKTCLKFFRLEFDCKFSYRTLILELKFLTVDH